MSALGGRDFESSLKSLVQTAKIPIKHSTAPNPRLRPCSAVAACPERSRSGYAKAMQAGAVICDSKARGIRNKKGFRILLTPVFKPWLKAMPQANKLNLKNA